MDIFLDLISGGNSAEFLTNYLHPEGTHSLPTVRSSVIEAVAEKVIGSDDVLENCKAILSSIRDVQTYAGDPVLNSIRKNLLKIFAGSSSAKTSRNSLKQSGWKFSNDTWMTVCEHNTNYAMTVYVQNEPGHPPISEELKQKINKYVMTEEFTYCLPSREREGNNIVEKNFFALIEDVVAIYRNSPFVKELGITEFQEQLSGRKGSACPKIRTFKSSSDLCTTCATRRKVYRSIKQLIGGIKTSEIREECDDMFTRISQLSEQSVDPNLGREESLKITEFIQKLAMYSRAKIATIKTSMRLVVAVGFHRYIKTVVNAADTVKWSKSIPMKAGVMRWKVDWRMGLVVGQHREETSFHFHNYKITQIFGIAFQFVHPTYGKNVNGSILLCTDVQDKTAAAAISMENYALARMEAEYPLYSEVLPNIAEREVFADAGKHFYNGWYLAHVLIEFCKKHVQTVTNSLQIYQGGHGKSQELDAGSFAIVAKAHRKAIKKGQPICTTMDVRNMIDNHRKKDAHMWSKEKQELNPFFTWVWAPGKHPPKASFFDQDGLETAYAWKSVRDPTKPIPTLKVSKYGITVEHDNGTRLTPIHSSSVPKGTEFRVFSKKFTDGAGNIKTDWKFRAQEIAEPPPVNVAALEKRRATILGASITSLPVQRVRMNGVCTCKPRWNLQQLKLVLDQNAANGTKVPFKGNELDPELRAHKVSVTGTLLDKVGRLAKHLREKKHQEVTQRAAMKSLSEYFRSDPADDPNPVRSDE